MSELLTAAQMRAVEQAAIEAGLVTGLELMERAGRGVVDAVFEKWPELAQSAYHAMVLCGPGNNGGDGFVVARLLTKLGWPVEVFLYGNPEKLPPDARVNYQRWGAMGAVQPWDDAKVRDHYEGRNDRPFLVVDALFGTGLTRSMPDDTEEAWNGFMPNALPMNGHDRGGDRFVAIDFPSGICSDSGRDFGALPTHLTVTFHRAKLGHYLSQNCGNYGGAYGCNTVKVVDIGLGLDGLQGSVQLIEGGGQNLLKSTALHKFSYGHALILSGGPGKTGAARLAARGALRIGAGLVTLGVPPAAQLEVAGQITAIMLQRVADGPALSAVLQDDRLNAICLGPGLGVGVRTKSLVKAALSGRGLHPPYAQSRGVVLDADALTSFAENPQELFDLVHENCVLTPHGGEFARLFPDIAAKLAATATKGPAYSKVDATREAAACAGCVVLFKGADTVIAAPDGQCSINPALYDRAAPWLATAGSGDVLAGFIIGLMARGFKAKQAAETAAWLHVECALSFGPGLIAEDIPEELPTVFRALEV